jgi:hypothetical protein
VKLKKHEGTLTSISNFITTRGVVVLADKGSFLLPTISFIYLEIIYRDSLTKKLAR